MDVPKCANAHDAYLECTDYAVTQLNLANVAMYLDAGKYPFNVLDGSYPSATNMKTDERVSWRGPRSITL